MTSSLKRTDVFWLIDLFNGISNSPCSREDLCKAFEISETNHITFTRRIKLLIDNEIINNVRDDIKYRKKLYYINFNKLDKIIENLLSKAKKWILWR